MCWEICVRRPATGSPRRFQFGTPQPLKPSYDALGILNLELRLHLLDGHEGTDGVFWQDGLPRLDVALKNKRYGMLHKEERFPESWCEPAVNKGLVRDDLSMWWALPEREREDLPMADDRLQLVELN
jgi:hypothetical protein